MAERKRPFHLIAKPVGPICNLDCAYCFYLEKEALYPGRRDFRMSDATLEAYIRQVIAASPGPEVAFAWQGGEPTVLGVDFFRNAVAIQKRLLPPGWTCTNAIQTNGTLLDEEWCRFLADERFLVGISIDGPSDLHDRYRLDKGGRPTHEKAMRGLRLLQAHGVEHNVLCVVSEANARHPLEVYRFFKEHGVTWLQFIPLVEPTGDPAAPVTPRSVRAEDYGRFLTTVFDEWVRHDVGRIFIQLFEEALRVYCGLPAGLCIFAETCGSSLALEHNGDLYACDHYVDPEHLLGNIHQTPLEDLLDAPAQRRFGRAKRDGLPAYCRRCDVRFLCNGECPRNRFLRTPDGEPGLNYLCEGYRRFFRHIDPYMHRLAQFLRRGLPPALIMQEVRQADADGWARARRNDPCPCGSGKKYKVCCMPHQTQKGGSPRTRPPGGASP